MYNTDQDGIDRECIFESAKEPQYSIPMPGTLNKTNTIPLLTKGIPETKQAEGQNQLPLYVGYIPSRNS